jgi:hypothetical protein
LTIEIVPSLQVTNFAVLSSGLSPQQMKLLLELPSSAGGSNTVGDGQLVHQHNLAKAMAKAQALRINSELQVEGQDVSDEGLCLVLLEVVNKTSYIFELVHQALDLGVTGTESMSITIGPQAGKRYASMPPGN